MYPSHGGKAGFGITTAIEAGKVYERFKALKVRYRMRSSKPHLLGSRYKKNPRTFKGHVKKPLLYMWPPNRGILVKNLNLTECNPTGFKIIM